MNPDQVLTMRSKSEYNVKIPSDKASTCSITGICSLPSGHVIVVDNTNKKVILLDKSCNVSSHCDVSDPPLDICPITSSEVAVTVMCDVQFISISNGQLVIGRKMELSHYAVGIAHHQGALYITDYTALYHYPLTGTLAKKIYEDTGGDWTG
ncbi:hypothetical protein DPMN_051099 [Dreissena polymorpha]|uniref:Uncharacterized protein n=1 Tax=Dreissena polymorpha TaxID=45954 RepID=A0A9D4CHA3_DREPO|nr:hypothetical protein DPMN_051099 [Dreissena polymorpha]